MGVWVYEADGSLQCGMGNEISLADMEKELAAIVGEANILNRRKGHKPGFYPALCGAPNGQVNLYELTSEGFALLEKGIVGPTGFQKWVYGPVKPATSENIHDLAGPEVPFPYDVNMPAGWLLCPDCPFPMNEAEMGDKVGNGKSLSSVLPSLTSATANAVLVRELIGYSLRVIKPGEAVDFDFSWRRVNFILDDAGHIKDIAFF